MIYYSVMQITGKLCQLDATRSKREALFSFSLDGREILETPDASFFRCSSRSSSLSKLFVLVVALSPATIVRLSLAKSFAMHLTIDSISIDSDRGMVRSCERGIDELDDLPESR